ncbi:MAG: hypothetical protein KBS74_06920 [Clostridiales bacterium]|nr:hypothetical protein [Candidatus Cacconaster stercorequi]
MKKRIIAALLTMGMLLSLCACGTQHTRWLWTKKTVDLPSDFGNVLALAQSDHGTYVASYEALGIWHSEDNSVETLDTIYSKESPAMVYGMAAQEKTVYLLIGEMLPQYTTADGIAENPDFSGRYCVTTYVNCKKSKTTDFSLSCQEILKGILALRGEEILCWSDEAVWVIRLSDGSVAQHYKTDGHITGAVTSENGTWLWVQKDGKNGCYPIQESHEALGTFMALPENTPNHDGISVSSGKDGFLSDGEILYTFDGQMTKPFMRWGECNLTASFVSNIAQLDADRLLCLSPDNDAVYLVSRQQVDSNCSELHIATAAETVELDKLLEIFNRENPDYIAMVDVYPFGEYDRLCTEMMAGDGPDVLDVSGFSMPLDTPYLTDLSPFIDADPDLTQEIFVPSVLSSLRHDGVLRSLPAEFSLATLTVKDADTGGATHWSFDEMRQLLAQKGNGVRLLPRWLDRKEFLLWLAIISSGSFIDWNSHTAHFDSTDFREYLQFCKEQPPEGRNAVDIPHLVELTYLQNMTVIHHLPEEYGNEPFTFIGFPSESGSGTYFMTDGLHFAISESSTNKDAAWVFIRGALTEQFQKSLNALPIRQDVLDAEIVKAVQDIKYQKQITDLVAQEHPFANDNMKLQEIIRQEAAAFFDDKKTVEEASLMIQNRATLYLSEIG